MANVKIILIVDTARIFKAADKKSKKSIDACCSFVDNTKYIGPPGDPEKYETFVEQGQIVEWSAVAKDPHTCDCVSVDSIAHEMGSGSTDLFGSPVLIGSGGVIRATVLAQETTGSSETYTLRFTVIRNRDGFTEAFSIDPKLGINN